MYIIVAGGGKVGFYLARELIAGGHEVLLIEKSASRCEVIAAELGNVVQKGNADEASVLADAGTNRANVVVAVTGDDEDNLVICQVAKRRFNVPRVIARINNPKNEGIFRLLGIDATVSSTDLILSVIEQEIPEQALVPLLRLRHADVEVVDITLKAPVGAAGAGQVAANRKKFRGQLGRADGGGWQLVWSEEPAAKPGQRVSRKKEPAPLQAIGFTLDELKEARLAPVVDFKGRRPRQTGES